MTWQCTRCNTRRRNQASCLPCALAICSRPVSEYFGHGLDTYMAQTRVDAAFRPHWRVYNDSSHLVAVIGPGSRGFLSGLRPGWRAEPFRVDPDARAP